MFKMIIGLGNPVIFRKTRHNVGKLFLDSLTSKWEYTRQGQISNLNGILLYQPSSYMNIIGEQVKNSISKYEFKYEEILVVHDDIEIDLGKVKLKTEGSAKGHNGIRSIMNSLDTDKFGRLRIGIGRPNGGEVSEYVLTRFSKAEMIILEEKVFPLCLEMIQKKTPS